MLKATLSAGQGISHDIVATFPPLCGSVIRRFLSTNTAIQRGIRKSNSRESGSSYRSQFDGGKGTSYVPKQASATEKRYASPKQLKSARPQRQDAYHVTEREESRGGWRGDKASKGYRTRIQDIRHTASLGRQPGSDGEPARFKNREDSFRAQVRDYEARSSSRTRDDDAFEQHGHKKMKSPVMKKATPGVYQNQRGREDGSFPSPSHTSAKLSRAEHRAAIYGIGDTAPGGVPRFSRAQDHDEDTITSNQSGYPEKRRESIIRSSKGPRIPRVHNQDENITTSGKFGYGSKQRESTLNDSNEKSGKGAYRDAETLEGGLEDSNDRQPWKGGSHAPLSIPYTTPASEFLYGTSVITAALNAQRRKLYKLYMYDGENREVRVQDQSIHKLALANGVKVVRVQGDWLRLMDKMSTGRPHNGYILEASPLPKLPVIGLQPVLERKAAFDVSLDHQSREEEIVNGKNSNIEQHSTFPRYPFVLLVDGILDPGNLGAILRTAFFLGVDALAISTRNSAPLSPVALKASAGSCENLPVLSVSNTPSFIDNARNNGWKFYAAIAPDGPGVMPQYQGKKRPSYYSTSTLVAPTQKHPCVLMLGGEGEGLRWNLQKKADYLVGVEGNRVGQAGVDSLNVSVAAGLLCEAFMKRPIQKPSAQSQISNNASSSLEYEPSDTTTHVATAPVESKSVTQSNPDSENNGSVRSDEDIDANANPASHPEGTNPELQNESADNSDPTENSPSIEKNTNRLF